MVRFNKPAVGVNGEIKSIAILATSMIKLGHNVALVGEERTFKSLISSLVFNVLDIERYPARVKAFSISRTNLPDIKDIDCQCIYEVTPELMEIIPEGFYVIFTGTHDPKSFGMEPYGIISSGFYSWSSYEPR